MVNWPLGKLFLGDGGSYFVGFSIAMVAIMLVERNLSIATFAVLLICFLPVMEVLFTIFRRRKNNKKIINPDRLHLHSLIKNRYINKVFPNNGAIFRNSITGILIGSITLITGILANLIYDSIWKSISFLVIAIAIYIKLYLKIIRFKIKGVAQSQI